MRKFLIGLAFFVSLNVVAAVGDTTPLPARNIVEIKQEKSTTSKGKEKIETIVIYKDAAGKRRMAYMTLTDFRKYEKADKYEVDVDFYIVEGKTRNKITVK